MDLSVVIPTHNRHQDVSRLLESLLKQNLGPLRIEVLVVANIHDTVLESIISHNYTHSLFSIRYLASGKSGVNWARNTGIENAQATKIYFLDDDILLHHPFHLQKVFQLSLEHPDASAIGGSYTLGAEAKILDEVYHAICTAWLQEGSSKGTFHLVGGNTLYNRELLQERLKFNELIKFGGSETELNLKLHMAGDKFLFSNTIDVEHSTHLSTLDLIKKAVRQGMGRSFHEMIVPGNFWQVDVISPKVYLNKHTDNKILYSIATQYLSLYDFFFHVGYRHGKRQNNGQLSFFAVLICIFQTFFQINADQVLFIPDPKAKQFHQKKLPSLKFREIYHWMKANVWWKIPFYLFTIIPHYLMYFFYRLPFYLFVKTYYILKFIVVHTTIHTYNFFRYKMVHLIWFIFHFIYYSCYNFYIRLNLFETLKWKIRHYFMLCFNFTVWKIVPLAGSIVIFSITNFFPFNTIGLRVPYNNAFNAIENFLKRRN